MPFKRVIGKTSAAVSGRGGGVRSGPYPARRPVSREAEYIRSYFTGIRTLSDPPQTKRGFLRELPERRMTHGRARTRYRVRKPDSARPAGT